MDDLISRQAAIDEVVTWLKDRMTDGKNGKPLTDRLKDLPSAQPEPYIDSIVSEIKKTISETKKSGKHHEIHIRTNGEMICYGLQLALDIIEEKKNERIN